MMNQMSSIPKQLTLNVTTTNPITFANFYSGTNSQVLHSLKALDKHSAAQFIYLWGEPAAGKTHLLKALCQNLSLAELSVFYLSGKNLNSLNLSALNDLDQLHLLALDDLDLLIGSSDWEKALFHCYNRLTNQNGNLVVAATGPPNTLNFTLPDLKSRMNNAIIFKLAALEDQDKILALELRAKQNGILLPRVTSKFLLNHSQRDLTTLFNHLTKLSQATLYSKGKITIPLAKKILEI